ncbi:MAG: hypothetical protein HZB25_07865 [Candidatus Eisenbacteria bacterium]|nr:hypothetical protein [Candidatus Eisenbacteria bacterium]
MIKKLAAFFLMAILTVALATAMGCGKKAEEGTTTEGTTTEATTSTTTPAPAESGAATTPAPADTAAHQ